MIHLEGKAPECLSLQDSFEAVKNKLYNKKGSKILTVEDEIENTSCYSGGV